MTHQEVQVGSLSSYAPHKTLGHWKAPAGKSTTQLRIIMSKMTAISLRISTSHLSRFGARLAYHAIYVGTLRYVLPQCHFSPTKLRQAAKKSMPPLYAKCGFSRKTPLALLYAPREYGGGGFLDWDVIQGEGQILHFLKHWRTTTDISTTLRINLSWCQWQAGTSTSILQNTNPDQSQYLEARWIPSLRDALHRFGASILVDDDCIPKPERVDDKYIMDVVHNHPGLPSKSIRIINYCRLYLHITTLSEMFDATGTSLLPHILRCERPAWFDPTINVTIQKRPSDFQIRTRWQPFCLELSHQHTQGPWILPLRLRRETYCQCFPNNVSQFYHWYAGAYWLCTAPSSVTGRVQLTLRRPTPWVPTSADAVPIQSTARVQHTIYTQPHYGPRVEQPNDTGFPQTSFSDHIRRLAPWVHQLLSHVNWVSGIDQTAEIIASLHSETPLLVVSDGSSIETQHMSFGVTIGTTTGLRLVELSGVCTGPPSSHRAECTGCLAGALFCHEFFRFTNTTHTQLSILVASDNQGMIKSLTDRMSYTKVFPNSTLQPDWDLLEEIVTTYRQLEVHDVTFEWVRGHQDTGHHDHDLSPQAIYNIRSDQLANEFTCAHGLQLFPEAPIMPTTRCQLLIHGLTITSNHRAQLRIAGAEPAFFDYMTSKHQWSSTTVDDIDWDSFCMAARTYSSTEVHLLKLVHDKLPSRRHTSRHQKWIHASCHYCSSSDTLDHLQTGLCNPASIKYRNEINKSVAKYLSQRQCSPSTSKPVLVTLNTWLENSTSSELTNDSVHSRQTNIGLQLFTRGFLTRKWREIFSDPSLSTPTTPLQARSHELTIIISGLIKVMWRCLGNLWLDHLQTIHDTQRTRTSPVTLASLRAQVRLIHALKAQTQPIHAHYFHDDIDEYLHKSTIQSLQTYIQHYLPPILTSIKQATAATDTQTSSHNSQARSVNSLPQSLPDNTTRHGFQHTTVQPTVDPPPPFVPPQVTTTQHHALEETPHRKRTRRRTVSRVLRALRNWARRRTTTPVSS